MRKILFAAAIILLAPLARAQSIPFTFTKTDDGKIDPASLNEDFDWVVGQLKKQQRAINSVSSSTSSSSGGSGSTVTVTSPLSGNGSSGSPVALTGAIPTGLVNLSTVTTQFNSVATSTTAIQAEIVALGASTTTIAASTTTLFTLITTSTAGVQAEIVALGASTQTFAGTIGASTQSIVTTIGASTQSIQTVIGASTQTLYTNLNSIKASTGTSIAFSTVQITQNGSIPSVYPNTPLLMTGNINSYFQSVIQNYSHGTNASADLVGTNDLGGNSSYYFNLGINGSSFSQVGFAAFPASATYLYSSDSPLILWGGGNGAINGGVAGDLVFGTSVPSLGNIAGRVQGNNQAWVLNSSVTIKGSGLGVDFGITASSVVATSATFTGTGASTYGLTISSGMRFLALNAGIKWADGSVSTTASAGGGGGGISQAYTFVSTVNALGAGSVFTQRSTVAFDSTYFTVIDSGTNNASVISLKSGSAAAGWTRQIFLSGSGTYTTPSGAVQLRVRMVAGGGGGGACTTNSGANGNTTSFGTVNVSSGNGGGPAGPPLNGQVGGTGGVGPASIRMPGGGGGAIYSSGACFYGGTGGASALGPSPAVLNCNNDGSSALANTGAGGVGGSCSGGGGAGAGGSGGEYAELIINSPAATYPYYIGAGGSGGAAGTHAGGNGGSGIIIVDELYPPIMAVSGTLGYVKDDFKPQANGTTKIFTLSQPPSSSSSIFVNLDGTIISGIYDYTFTAPTTITLTTAPATQCTVAAPGNCTSVFEVQYAINTSTLPAAAILTTTQTFSGQNSFSTDTYLNGTWIGSRSSPGTSSGVFLDTTTGTGGVILWSADGQTVSSGCIVAIYFDTTRGYLVESSTTVDSGSRSYGVTRDTCAPSTFCRIITHGMVYFQGNTGTTAGNLITSSTARCVGSNNGGVMYSPSVTDCSGGVRCRGYFPW